MQKRPTIFIRHEWQEHLGSLGSFIIIIFVKWGFNILFSKKTEDTT